MGIMMLAQYPCGILHGKTMDGTMLADDDTAVYR